MKLRLAIVASISIWSAAAQVHAQGLALDRFSLAPTPEDGLALQLPSTLGPGRFAARLSLGYQREPLVSGSPLGTDVAVVQDHVAAQLALAIGLGERIELSALLPVTLYQHGEKSAGSGLIFNEPDSTGLGDAALGASAHLLGDRDHGFQLGLNGAVLLPIGSSDALSSDGKLGARGTLSAALALDGVTFAIEGGAQYRAKRTLGFVDTGSELIFRAGAYVPIAERWRVLAELNGATRLESGKTFDGIATPLEALLGGEYASEGGWHFGLAGGPGLTLATGTPLFRVLGTVGYAGPREAPAPEPRDRDRDGFDDDHDKCPDQPEDKNGFEDADGCPDATRDGDSDGIADVSDRCPAEPEDKNAFEDADGCPDAARDSDGDSVPDASDKCVGEAEDKDGVDDEDGCPDADAVLDSDKDGIADGSDRCPTEAEIVNGIEDDDGCPDQAKPELVLPEPLSFQRKSAVIGGKSVAALQGLLTTLRENPELRISIEGHSSGDGSADFNQKLSEQRAAAVKAWLVKRGIADNRLETQGHGANRPRTEGDDEPARAQNRRVEFQKLQ